MNMTPVKFVAIAVVAFVLGGQRGAMQVASAQTEPWRTSWTAFAQATKAFLDEELRNHPEKPDFPQAGRIMLAVGEATKPDLPVMKRFAGAVIFKAKLTRIEKTPAEVMPGQPFKIVLQMAEPGLRGWIGNPDHVYPKLSAVAKWSALPIGSEVSLRAVLSGIAATGLGGQYFCTVLFTEAEPIETK